MVKNKALPESARLCTPDLVTLSFSLSPSQTWPCQGWSHASSLSLSLSLSHRRHSSWGYPLDPAEAGPRHCSSPGFSGHGILQARILEFVAISCSRWSSQPRNGNRVSWIAGGSFITRAISEAHTSENCENKMRSHVWQCFTICTNVNRSIFFSLA